MESPFEPLSSAIFKFVTLKTIFLLAIASGRRRKGLQALGCDSGHIRWGPSGVVLIPHPGFLAKNESQNYMAKRIYLPKMSTFSSVKGDRLLCPRRALSYYLTKTKKLRKLFITYKEGCHRAASHDAISKWIVRTISICYQCSKESDFSLARTHDTRSLSTSLALFNGLSMEEIMEAASWKSESTFTAHYLTIMSEERGRFARMVLSSKDLS
jgi:hypothetical protein